MYWPNRYKGKSLLSWLANYWDMIVIDHMNVLWFFLREFLFQNPEFSSNCYVLQSRHPPHLVEVGRDGSFMFYILILQCLFGLWGNIDLYILILQCLFGLWGNIDFGQTLPYLRRRDVSVVFFDYETDPIAFGTRDMSTQVDLCMCFTSVGFSDMRYLWTLFIIMLPFNYEGWEGSYCLLFYGSWLFTACLIARERCSMFDSESFQLWSSD